MMSKILVCLFPIILLSACSIANENTYNIDSYIYFDTHGNLTDSAIKGGYVRRILSQSGTKEYTVQDFYNVGGRKRTDPMTLKKQQLYQFKARPNHTIIHTYRIDGTMLN